MYSVQRNFWWRQQFIRVTRNGVGNSHTSCYFHVFDWRTANTFTYLVRAHFYLLNPRAARKRYSNYFQYDNHIFLSLLISREVCPRLPQCIEFIENIESAWPDIKKTGLCLLLGSHSHWTVRQRKTNDRSNQSST